MTTPQTTKAKAALNRYDMGLIQGNPDILADVLIDTYILDDPNAECPISKREIPGYFQELKKWIRGILDAQLPTPFMEFLQTHYWQEDERLHRSCMWAIPGTDLKGYRHAVADENGVVSERITSPSWEGVKAENYR